VVSARAILGLALILAGSGIAHAQPQPPGPAAWWSFDDDPGEGAARDRAGSISDTIEGRTTRVAGVVGRAIRLDGFTSLIRRNNAAAPKVTGAFTVESWVALAAYPWNWAPIVDHERDEHAGYYFGIGPLGEVGLELSHGGHWLSCRTDSKLKLRKFTHVAAVFDPDAGITVFVDGSVARKLRAQRAAALRGPGLGGRRERRRGARGGRRPPDRNEPREAGPLASRCGPRRRSPRGSRSTASSTK
jgi:hypothetical protein